jgi:hypothetical protein
MRKKLVQWSSGAVTGLMSITMGPAHSEVIILKGAIVCRSFVAAKEAQWAEEAEVSALIRAGKCYVAKGNAPTIVAERGPDIVEFRTADNPTVRKFTLIEHTRGFEGEAGIAQNTQEKPAPEATQEASMEDLTAPKSSLEWTEMTRSAADFRTGTSVQEILRRYGSPNWVITYEDGIDDRPPEGDMVRLIYDNGNCDTVKFTVQRNRVGDVVVVGSDAGRVVCAPRGKIFPSRLKPPQSVRCGVLTPISRQQRPFC